MAENDPTGATPASGPDPGSGAMPPGQTTGSGATPPPGSNEGATPDPSLGDAGRQALEREREARREADRALAEVRRQVADLEDRGKTGEELARARLSRAEADLETARAENAALRSDVARRELDALKLQVATEAGLPASIAPRLQGDDLRALRADANRFRDEINAGQTGSVGIGVGGAASGQRGRVDMNTLIRQAAGRDG